MPAPFAPRRRIVSPELKQAVYAWERSLRKDLAVAMTDLFGAEVAASPSFADAIEMTLQFMRGSALTLILREDVERQTAVVDQWKSVFAELVRSERGA